MISWIGNLGLALGVLSSGAALGACIASVMHAREPWLVVARRGLVCAAVFMGAALGALAAGFVSDSFGLSYVAAHSERSLPLGLKVAALWSGQEGSLLLWAGIVGAISAGAAMSRRRKDEPGEAVVLATFAVVCGFFGVVLLTAANPFRAGLPVPEDGTGLSPLLRHWAMVIHPPVLFSGYAMSLVPFALALGALASGRQDDRWVAGLRIWALGGWGLLTAGIALGGWWAYVQLGWGGYWAWDPVENASLLPWLTGTALVHTIGVHRRRGVLRAWTFLLASGTFLLCILGTAMTRGGLVESVHAFARSSIGTPFLALVGAGIVVTAGVSVRKRACLRDNGPIDRPLSREGIVLAADVLLVLMAATTLLGTFLPVIAGALGRPGLSVGPIFYYRAVVPMGLAAGLLMALGPILPNRDSRVEWRRFILPGTAAVLAVGASAVLGVVHGSALACIGIGVFTVVSLVRRIARDVSMLAGAESGGGPVTLLSTLSGQRTRYAGYLAHVGFTLLLVGVAGSSLYARVVTSKLRAGESVVIGDRTITLQSVGQVRGPDYSAVECVLNVTGADGEITTLRPRQRFYDRSMEASGEVAVSVGWREDLYIALLGWERGGAVAAIQARVNPLTSWVWTGAIAMVAGTLIGLAPGRRVPAAAPADAPGATELVPAAGEAAPPLALTRSLGT